MDTTPCVYCKEYPTLTSNFRFGGFQHPCKASYSGRHCNYFVLSISCIPGCSPETGHVGTGYKLGNHYNTN